MEELMAYLWMPLLLPVLGLWYHLAWMLAVVSAMAVIPVLMLSHRLYWCCPVFRYIWRSYGPLGVYLRAVFETAHCMNTFTRLLTLPLRQKLPDFYIVGFPNSGTLALASMLARHPAIDPPVGLSWHPILSKESHFFNGILGRHQATSPALYRSFFPTIVRQWWVEVVTKTTWLCFDACPVVSCLPFAAERMAQMTPDAKCIFMFRDPVASIFTAELTMHDAGMPLAWSLMEPLQSMDPRFMELKIDVRTWESMKKLRLNDPLPEEMPDYYYTHIHSYLQSGCYIDRIKPFLKHFPREKYNTCHIYAFRRIPINTV